MSNTAAVVRRLICICCLLGTRRLTAFIGWTAPLCRALLRHSNPKRQRGNRRYMFPHSRFGLLSDAKVAMFYNSAPRVSTLIFSVLARRPLSGHSRNAVHTNRRPAEQTASERVLSRVAQRSCYPASGPDSQSHRQRSHHSRPVHNPRWAHLPGFGI